jgi:NAD(P)-dependent dehydrogenase (short-subunit alcohol dehydrogenase family)
MSTSDLLDLGHQTAIVTGGAKGIGKAIAERFAAAKAAVMIADLDDKEARKTVDCIRAGAIKPQPFTLIHECC